MVKPPCPSFHNGRPGPIQRWIERVILRRPRLLRCAWCGELHITAPGDQKGGA